MKHRLLRLAGAFLLALPAALAHAERADRNKPVNVEADRLTADDAQQIAIFEGRVVLTQGAFVLRADRLVLKKDAAGFQRATATGSPASFREKREGVDEWIDGEASRIEYDGRREFIELIDNARLNRDKDQVKGSYISYDPRADYFTVQSGPGQTAVGGPATPRDERVRATFQPQRKAGAPPSNAPLPLQTTPKLEPKRPE